MTFVYSLGICLCLFVGCSGAKFSSDGGKSPPPKGSSATAVPTPVKAASPAPTSEIPSPCVAALETGIVDKATNLTFRLQAQKMSYDAGVAACEALKGKMIYGGQKVSDEVLACEGTLGTLWMLPAPAALNFIVPTDSAVVNRSTLNWILCYGTGI